MNNKNSNLPGYILLNTLIESDNVYTIDVLINSQETNSYEKDTKTIKYNPNTPAKVVIANDVYNDGKFYYREFETVDAISCISLSHELVHAYREETSQSTYNEKVEFEGVSPDSNGKRVKTIVQSEEFETVGLVGWSVREKAGNQYIKDKYPVITENMIRNQLGKGKRGWYYVLHT
ncbi:MAG: M91 family zinc metallopeptidase [Clostridia bacterium]|nr:M91 family zinc metallopeptidase [Clostridia bacterium]